MRVIGANELPSGALDQHEGDRQVLRLVEEAFEPADTPLNQAYWVVYYGSVIRQLTRWAARDSGANLSGMAKRHAVFMSGSLEDIRVKHRDVVFFVYKAVRGSRSAKFGELRVSQGAVVWRGRRDKKGRKLNWLQFERLMQEQGHRAERRRIAERVSVPPSKRRR